MDTVQILCTLRYVTSFLDVFPSHLLPQSITQTSTVIVNADPHTEGGSHCLAVHFRLKSSSAYHFDSYGILPLLPSFQAFIKRNSKAWGYNRRQLQGLTTDVLESIAVYSPSTWIRATRRNSSSRYLIRATMQTGRWSGSSLPNSGSRCLGAAVVNAAVTAYK